MGLLDNALQALKSQYEETKGNVGLLVSDPKRYMSGLNQDAAEYNRLSSLALQAERNAYRGIPVSQEQAAAKQYIDQQQQDMALGFTGSVKPTGKFINEAHQTASINAEKMLGLPSGNTAMDRAKAMGFNIPAYHGSTVNFRIPERDVFVSEAPSIANRYAFNKTDENSLVMPMLVKENTPKFEHLNANTYRLTPENVRSRFAAFDPARANEADLLAGVIPLGLIAGKDQLELKKEKKPKK